MTKLLFTFLSILLFSAFSWAQEEPNAKVDSVTQQFPFPKEVTPDLSVITPPVGFDTSGYFTGYINFKKGSAIMIHEMENADFTKVEEGITEDYFTQNNLTLIKKEKFVSTHNTNGLYYMSSFVNKEVKYIRIMVYAGSEKNLLVLDIVYPESAIESVEKGLLESINSLNYQR